MKSRIIISCIGALLSVAFFATPSRAQTTFIDTNSVWKYLADGTSLDGINWQAPIFSDITWSNGVGRMGFGDTQRTVIGVAANGYTNFYFRHSFNVIGAAGIANLVTRYQRDDGLILYLNGTEVLRTNMPAGPVGSATQATAAIGGADETAFLTNSLNPALLVEGNNVIAAEVHQSHGATTFSSDLAFYLELVGGVPPQPPAATVVNPANGTVLQVNNVTLNATASDVDGTVTQVEFFSGNTSLGVDATTPYGLVVNGVAPGSYTFRAVATDSQGLRGTSAPVTVTVVAPLPSLIPFGASWRYLDNGTDQGSAWIAPTFIDTSWSTGVAELGFGDNDEATLISRTGTGGGTNITTYFRHTFNVAAPGSISSLVLRLVRDDGAIVYLNGTEVLRDNLTNNIIDYLTTAAVAVEDEPILVTNVSPALLVAGANTIAVEIHQQSTTSSDVSFDLNLIPNAGANPPVVQLTAPPNGTNILSPATFDVAATAYDLDGMIANVQFLVDGVQSGALDMTVPYGRTATGIGVGQHLVQAIATDNSGLTSTASITVVVSPGSISFPLIGTNLIWRYLDDGSDQGTAWTGLGFSDAAWRSGRAELGFGDADEMTVIRQTNQITGMTNVTFYFRREFDVANPGAYSNLVLNLRRDDGGVVYINAVEVFRSNMTNGPGVPILYTDFAGNNTGSETAFNTTNLSPAVLIAGRNIIAVEVHQQNLTSSDISFDLQLFGQRASGPLLSIVNTGAAIVLSWFPNTAGFVLQQAPAAEGPWTTSANQSNPQNVSPTGLYRYFRLCNGCP